MKRDLTFVSHGVRCAAWHLPAGNDALAGPLGRPCVVMAHGFGGTRDSGLLNYAEGFAEAGIDAFVFDYRGFGDSGGTPRQDVSVRRQRQDYHAALAAARRLPGVDPHRIVLWGVSYAGGHALVVAAQDARVTAVVSLTPVTDGLASLAHLMRHAGPGRLLRLAGHGLRDTARALTGRTPHLVPVVGEPGALAMMGVPHAQEICASFAGPTFRNEVCARAALKVGLNRPTTFVRRLACPILVQIGTEDRIAPAGAARRTARKAGRWGELREYPVDHLDVYAGPGQQRALADQLAFLSRVLDPTRAARHPGGHRAPRAE
ncbi:alpha/beta hydrolase [Streptomyces sp. 15-116A]|uniref:alpha/beta hydrolase n=1 Tax=Streptomyces sp. 15-116A TaxID=2259035 RepID=UPI0021B15C9A|nr:alpha/beta hydrolase [Streptomyces sp. 15-116A]MCT7352810.1 alpha/beta hydrolase [Streptomyces sp. 15-116A]